MKIAVDVLGGDYAPDEILLGIGGALRSGDFRAEELLLVGPEAAIRASLAAQGVAEAPAILHTDQVIEGHEKPIEGLRAKPRASVAVCVGAVREGAAGGLVAFGNTGATVAAATMGLGLLPGLRRPGIGVTLTGESGRFVLLDVGANPAPKPLHLFQYALMGAAYARDLFAVAQPRVGLLNIGGEATKGTPLFKETHKALAEAADAKMAFVGNVEGNQLFGGGADVYVCDGFVGNMVLKVVEGFAEYLVRAAGATGAREGEGLKATLRRKLGAADFSEVGAATLLGVNGVVLIGHGRSRANAVLPALRTARAEMQAQVNRHIVESVAAHGGQAPAQDA
jgi:glycerol-3-phosphate acyltransferase PlsX